MRGHKIQPRQMRWTINCERTERPGRSWLSMSTLQTSGLVSGVDRGRLAALVTELEAAAEQHDSEFDGWGTELPPESS